MLVNSTVEPLEGNKVKLAVEVGATELEPAIEAAFKQLAKEIRLPGFRPGKAPRQLLEARIGPGYAREEALRQALPDFYAEAVREHDVDVIAPPELDITEGQEEGDVTFEAVVEVRPVVEISGYDDLTVEVPSPLVDDEALNAQIDQIREQHADLELVERPAEAGDNLTIDITGSQDGEELEGLTAEDYLFPLGMGLIVPELDENLTGALAGDTVTFEAEHPAEDDDETLSFTVVVKEVKAKALPELTDEFVAEYTDHDTVEALRGDFTDKLSRQARYQAAMALREKTAEAVGGLVEEEMPDVLIENEMNNRLQDLAMRVQAQGLSLEQYFTMTGQDPTALQGELRETAETGAKVDLALRALAVAEGLDATDEELDEELEGVADQFGRDIDNVRAEFERAGSLSAVRSDIGKNKALEWVLERVTVVDEDGHPVDRDLLDLEDLQAEEEHDHADHDHDDAADVVEDTGENTANTPEPEEDA
ncbi:MAG: trigger factor [Actinomycetia bacterium]|nr:trigger factor [Actinomycetes bacterium]